VAGVKNSPTVAEGWDIVHKFFRVHRVDGRPKGRYVGPRGIRFTITDLLEHRLPIMLAGTRIQREEATSGKTRR
jgi:hypothetical protein